MDVIQQVSTKAWFTLLHKYKRSDIRKRSLLQKEISGEWYERHFQIGGQRGSSPLSSAATLKTATSIERKSKEKEDLLGKEHFLEEKRARGL